jgi:hypothetical protein
LSAAVVPFDDAGAFGVAPSYVAGNYMLEIDGKSAGFLKSVGELGYTRIVDSKVAQHAAPMALELQLGLSSAQQLSWVAGFVSGKAKPRSVQIVATDYKLEAKQRYDLGELAITEVEFPACDGSSKEPAYLTVRGEPAKVARLKASGKAATEYGKAEQKMWLPSNFRLTIDGIDTTKVSFLGPIKVKKSKDGLAIMPFKVAFSEVTAETWLAWGEKTLVNGEKDQRTLKLELLTSDRTAVLATLDLAGVHVLSMNYGDKRAANADAIKRITFVLGAEGIKMTPPKATK